MTWRVRLFVGVLVVSWALYLWLYLSAAPVALEGLRLLAVVFGMGAAVTAVYYRSRLTSRLVTANLALGSLVHLVAAGLVVVGHALYSEGLGVSLAAGWGRFGIGVLGVMGAAITWTRAKGADEPDVLPTVGEAEPAPGPTPSLVAEPDWEALQEAAGTASERQHLATLHRLSAVLASEDPAEERVEAAARVVRQEAIRLGAQAQVEEDDVLTTAASLLEWGAQKLPELAELDVSDLLMAKAIADIRALKARVEPRFVDHRRLLAIHPIDRATAEDKCNERAEAARAAVPVLEANGWRLSESLIASEPSLSQFASITGFQVVEVDGGYVTFEGNGRREALRRAFGDEHVVQVEVRVFLFDDVETGRTIRRRVERVRRWKNVED